MMADSQGEVCVQQSWIWRENLTLDTCIIDVQSKLLREYSRTDTHPDFVPHDVNAYLKLKNF